MTTGELSRLADAVRGGQVSAAELVAEAQSRIDQFDGPINAVVARCDDAAEQAAAAVDAAVAAGRDPGPLAGIPVLVNMHDVELAKRFADRIIGMTGGRIVFDGPAAQLDDATLTMIYGGQGWLH